MTPDFDLVVFGATGFTGQLVAQYLHASYGSVGSLAWAMAGRNPDKLAQVRTQIGAGAAVPLVAVDAADAAALAALVRRTRAVITTVGPYQRYGEPLVEACAAAGTDYLDLCGEPNWMARMIAALEVPAHASGARIVFSCGFDSIPFDLGVVFLQDEAQRRFGAPLQRVAAAVRTIRGGFSGGTAASMLATFEQIARDPAVARAMADPFALTPGFRGPVQPDAASASFDELHQVWSAPFVMAPINTKNVHRTNALRGHPWGRDFVYSERLLTGSGKGGERRARLLGATARVQTAMFGFAPAREFMRRFMLPKPGQGPSARQRERGSYEIGLVGVTADGRKLGATVRGDRDPGYGSTSKMIAEAALCLLRDIDRTMTAGGVWTAGAAMGVALVRRLQAQAGLSFTIDT